MENAVTVGEAWKSDRSGKCWAFETHQEEVSESQSSYELAPPLNSRFESPQTAQTSSLDSIQIGKIVQFLLWLW